MLRAGVLAIALLAPASGIASEFCDKPGALEELRGTTEDKWRLFKDKRYADVEAFHSDLVAQYEAGHISDARLSRFFGAFFQAEPWVEPLLKEWVAKYPRSYAARLALANHYRAVGWAARGNQWGAKTSDEQFAGMRGAFGKARAILDEAQSLTRKPTLSDAARIDMAPADGAADPTQIYRRAIKAFPETLEVRIQYLRKSGPRWGGSIGRLESIVDDAKSLPPADRRYVEYLVDQEIAGYYWCSEREGCAGTASARAGENKKRVVEYYEKSAALCPGLDGSLDSLLQYLVERRDYPAIISTATRLIERKPRLGRAYASRGMAYGNTARLKEAFADYQRAAELNEAYAYKELAWFYESGTVVQKDVRKAIDLYLIAAGRDIEGARAQAERLSKSSGIPLK